MKNLTLSALLLSLALVASGCRSTLQPQPAQQRSSSASNEGDYNRSYDTESHRRHHHARRDDSASDNPSLYDDAETADRSSNSGSNGEDRSRPYNPRENGRFEARNNGAANGEGYESSRGNRHHNARALTSTPGQFDFYFLNLSWSPEFCHSHPTAAECAQHRAFTLHGLWPQNNDGTYPEDCSDAPGPANPAQYADIYPDPSLLQHEWQTHGTCSGLAPDQFLALDRRAEQSITIPTQLAHLTQQLALSPAQLTTLFTQANPGLPASSLAISCGNNYLTAVEVCLDKNLHPESCQAVKTCGATQIRIPAPQ